MGWSLFQGEAPPTDARFADASLVFGGGLTPDDMAQNRRFLEPLPDVAEGVTTAVADGSSPVLILSSFLTSSSLIADVGAGDGAALN